jgi:ArsR family transcriptional regulator
MTTPSPLANDHAVAALKALADPSRLRVFWLLAHIDERICVAEAMDVLGVSHYNASRHLGILKQADLVRAQRQGKWVFYTLNREGNPFIAGLIAAVREIPADDFAPEIERCRQRLDLREDDCCVIGTAGKA